MRHTAKNSPQRWRAGVCAYLDSRYLDGASEVVGDRGALASAHCDFARPSRPKQNEVRLAAALCGITAVFVVQRADGTYVPMSVDFFVDDFTIR